MITAGLERSEGSTDPNSILSQGLEDEDELLVRADPLAVRRKMAARVFADASKPRMGEQRDLPPQELELVVDSAGDLGAANELVIGVAGGQRQSELRSNGG